MDLFESNDPSSKLCYNYTSVVPEDTITDDLEIDQSVLDLTFDSDSDDQSNESESDFLAEREALDSLEKLQSTEYAQNLQLNPDTESTLVEDMLLGITTPLKDIMVVEPVIEDPAVQKLSRLQSAIAHQRAIQSALKGTVESLSAYKLDLDRAIARLASDCAINTSIHHKLTTTTRLHFSTLNIAYHTTSKQLSISLDRESRNRIELQMNAELLNTQRFKIDSDLSRNQGKIEGESGRAECLKEWIRVNGRHDFSALAAARIAVIQVDIKREADRAAALFVLQAAQAKDIAVREASLTESSLQLTTRRSTLTSLESTLAPLSLILSTQAPSLTLSLSHLESQLAAQIATKSRLMTKHESQCVKIEGMRVYVSGLKGEVGVYQDDVGWLGRGIRKVEGKIKEIEDAGEMDKSSVVAPQPQSHMVTERVSIAVGKVSKELVEEPILCKTGADQHKDTLRLPSISLPSLVTYASTQSPPWPALVNHRTYSLPQLMPLPQPQPHQQHSAPLIFKWDIPSAKSPYISSLPQEHSQLAVKTSTSRPLSSTSVHSFTSCTSAYDGGDGKERGWSAMKARHRYTH